MTTICVPVLRRYDLLRELVLSLAPSTVKPDRICIIDNGRDEVQLRSAMDAMYELGGVALDIVVPAQPLGVAESWNWFIRNVSEERLISNDDITFAPTSLAQMLAETACFVSCTFGFSCFLLRDACVRQVGEFDEAISPGYAYFEDRDYYKRMQLAGVADAVVDCGVKHAHSQTFAAFSQAEQAEHHRRFVIAQENFLKKWDELPADVERQFA